MKAEFRSTQTIHRVNHVSFSDLMVPSDEREEPTWQSSIMGRIKLLSKVVQLGPDYLSLLTLSEARVWCPWMVRGLNHFPLLKRDNNHEACVRHSPGPWRL